MGILINHSTFYTLRFADDQIIMARDVIEYMTWKLIEEYEKYEYTSQNGTYYECRRESTRSDFLKQPENKGLLKVLSV